MHRVQQFLSKFAMDVLRTGVASAIGALLFTHQWTQTAAPVPTQPVAYVAATEQATQMIRDEHDVMVQFLKAAHAKEVAAIEKEARDARAARIAAETPVPVRQADVETHKVAPAQHANPMPRVLATDNAITANAVTASAMPANGSAGTNAPTSPALVAAPAVVGANPTGSAVVAAPLPPPTVIPALPEPAPSKVEAPRSLADQAIAASHVKDAVSFVRDVSSWFKHEEAPVPPAEVRYSPFANANM